MAKRLVSVVKSTIHYGESAGSGARPSTRTTALSIQVVKGAAGSVEEDPYKVDGLSGATITSRGVTHLVQFWLGDRRIWPHP